MNNMYNRSFKYNDMKSREITDDRNSHNIYQPKPKVAESGICFNFCFTWFVRVF